MRIIFAGTPTFAASSLQTLIQSQHEIAAVYTAPDKPAGRGLKLTASPVKTLAQAFHIPVLQPTQLKTPDIAAEFAAFNPDIFIVAAYGFILPESLLSIPQYGSVNIHASLLPRWRGAAPIQRSILAGDKESGITLMQMDAGLDTGNILMQESFLLSEKETSSSLHDKLSELANRMLLPFLEKLEKHEIHPIMQNNDLATYAKKITKEEAQIHWDLSCEEIDRRIRGFFPTPCAYALFQNQPLKIKQAEKIAPPQSYTPGTIIAFDHSSISIACSQGGLRLMTVQLPNKNPMSGGDLARQFKDICQIGKSFI